MNALNQTLSACVIGCCGPPVAATTLSFSVATHSGAGGAAPAVVLPATDTPWTSAGIFQPLLLPMKQWTSPALSSTSANENPTPVSPLPRYQSDGMSFTRTSLPPRYGCPTIR